MALAPDDKDARRAVLKQLLLELDGESVAEVTLAQVVDAYLARLACTSRSRHTKRGAESTLRRVLRELGDVPVSTLTPARIQEWRLGRLSAGGALKTVNCAFAYLRAALNVAQAAGRIGSSPLAGVTALPEKDGDRVRVARALSDWEAARLLAAADVLDEKAGGYPQGLVLRTLLLTGARWGELVRARWSDVDLEGRTLRLRAEVTKNGTARLIPLDQALLDLLLAHRRTEHLVLSRKGHPQGINTSQILRFLRRAARHAGLPRVDAAGEVLHIHALRHTFVTRLMRAGVPIQHVQLLSGHKSVEVLTRVYTHLRIEDARKALECLPALGVVLEPHKASDGG